MHTLTKLTFTLAAVLALGGCSDPAPTPTPDPPEPQTASAPAADEEHTELRDAIQAPQDRARSVEVTLQDGAADRNDELEAAED